MKGSSSKLRMTAEKRAREQRLQERRAAKQERKAARKEEAEATRAAEPPPDPQAAPGEENPTP